VKQRIAVLTVFAFLFFVAAAPATSGAWPLWPKKSATADAAEQAPAPAVEAAVDASQAGEAGGEKVAGGFYTGNKGKLAAFGAAVIAVGVMMAGAGGSSTAHH
jgi:hypothetical protein